MAEKLYIETVGCQMNVLDSELVVGSLRRQGYELTHEAEAADVILFNTCSVRQHAEDKIYSALGRLRQHKRQHPDKIIGVLGCMAQKDQDDIRRRAPHVDIVCGTGQLARLPELIVAVRDTGKPQTALGVRKALERARVTFVDLLLYEVWQSLEGPTKERLEQELGDLRLLQYCRDALDRLPEE